MPGYGMPPQRQQPQGGGPPPPPPGSIQIAPQQAQMPPQAMQSPMQAQMPPQQAMQAGPDTGYMPSPGGGGMPPGMAPPMGGQGDPMQMLMAALRRQSQMPAANSPFLHWLLQSGLLGR